MNRNDMAGVAFGALAHLYHGYQNYDIWTSRALARDVAGNSVAPHSLAAKRWCLAGGIHRMRYRYPEDPSIPGLVPNVVYRLVLLTVQAESWRWCLDHGWHPATPAHAMAVANDEGGFSAVMEIMSGAMRVLAHEAQIIDVEEQYD